MTSLPNEANRRHWWMLAEYGDLLHALPADTWDGNDINAAKQVLDEPRGTSICNRTSNWVWPGLAARIVRPRCGSCCRKVGVASGNGTPANDPYLRTEDGGDG